VDEAVVGLSLCFGMVFLVVPVVAMVMASRARTEAQALRRALGVLSSQLTRLDREVKQLKESGVAVPAEAPAAAAAPEVLIAPAPVSPLEVTPEPAPEATPEPAPAEVAAAPDPVVAEAPRLPMPERTPPQAQEPFTPAEPPSPAPPPAQPIEWEKWLGVRGAAVLGGIVLAMAGLLFFKYSVERGWLSPLIRVGLATLFGVGALVAGEKLRKGYDVTAHALSGGGVVVLYAAIWAARILYELIPMEAAFFLMVLTTVVACLLALRHESQLVALLGLVGGFATPLLLATHENRPIGFFGYLLLLDGGFLWIAWRKQWRRVSYVALFGTLLMQAGWISSRMESGQLLLALGILGVFSVLFVLMSARVPEDASPQARRAMVFTQGTALLFPYAFATYFAASAELGHHLPALAGFMGLMGAGAAWLTRRDSLPGGVATAAASAQVAVLAVALGHHGHSPAQLWVYGACVVGLSALWWAFVEWPHGDEPTPALTRAATVALSGLALLFMVASLHSPDVEHVAPAVTGYVLLAALGIRLAVRVERPELQLVPVLLLATVFGLFRATWWGRVLEEGLSVPLGLGLDGLIAVVLLAYPRLRDDDDERLWAERGAAFYAIVSTSLVAFITLGPALHPPEVQLGALLVGLVGLAAGAQLRDARFLLGQGVALSLVQSAWSLRASEGYGQAFGLLAVSTLVSTYWPLLAGRRVVAQKSAAWAMTLPLVFSFLALKVVFERLGGGPFIGALPVACAAAALGALSWARSLGLSAEARRRMMVWLAGLALAFISVAIPLQLDRQWMTIGWAVMAVALLVLWRRLDHEGLKYFAYALLTIVTVRLVLNPEVLSYAERGQRIFNWLMYTYLVPAACLGAAAWLLGPLELPRLREWEKPFYPKELALVTVSSVVGLMLVVFAWLTLAVFDFFSPGASISVSFDRLPARDLTLSIVWLLYATVILAVGMWRASRGLRWASLVFMLVSIAKVFLYDLGQLTDLYRVMSLLGLAASLFVISLAYQRFVFRKEAP
jgi:uncharacterized membrane protein